MKERRLVGTSRDVDDAGLEGSLMWTVERVQNTARYLGKTFTIENEMIAKLNSDLESQSMIVIFTPEEVKEAVTAGYLSKNRGDELTNLVSEKGQNTVALIPLSSIETSKRSEAYGWFLGNSL